MKLRPWTFGKDKEAVLKWIGNVEIKDKQWRIRVAFEVDNQIEMLDFPIAALPLLRVGAFYKDGLLMDANTTGIIYDVNIPQLNQYKVVSSLDACKEFGYYLYKMPELMFQFVFEFTVEGNTYYLPQFEFIRAVFAVNKQVINAMMLPNGIEFLVKNSYFNNSRAYLELGDDIPNEIARDGNFLRYFAWLYFSPEIKASFESIHTKIKVKQNMGEFLKLEVQLPSSKNTQISFRGIQKGNKFLILQWLGSNIEGTIFSDIEVKHKAFKKRIAAQGKRKYRKSFQQNVFEKIINDNTVKRSKQDTNQPVEEILGTQFDFGNPATIHKLFGDIQEINQGDIYISNQGQGGGVQKQQQQIVGLDESVYGGTIQPIEFNSLEVTGKIKRQGLEKFIRMIQLLATDTHKYQVAMNLINLPLGRKFSLLPDGTRRICCLVYVKCKLSNKEYYIIEIATPDKKNLSTLILKSMDKSNIELSILTIIKGLVYNGGNWKTEELDKYNFKRLKHVNQNYFEWKIRLEKAFQ